MPTSPQLNPRSFLSILLTVFIGILVAGFIGLGIAAFYTAPTSPAYPEPKVAPTTSMEFEQQAISEKAQDKYAAAEASYQVASNHYNRNVSIIALIAAVLILVISLVFLQETLLIADGLLLGSVFILLYSIGRSIGSGDSKFQFLIVTVGLIVTLILSYLKFVKPAKV